MELLKSKMLLIQALVESKINKKKKIVFLVFKIMNNNKNPKNKILLQKIKINLADLEEKIIALLKMQVFIFKMHQVLENMRIQKIKIANSDQTWRIRIVTLTRLQTILHVDYLPFLMDMEESKLQSTVQKLFLLK